MDEELKRGCVVFMKASSGLIGYGNAQCVSGVHGELGTISLYGHNQHYKTYDIDKIVEYPKDSQLAEAEGETAELKNWEILWFAKKMFEVLEENRMAGKRGWDGMDNEEILERIDEELEELKQACQQGENITKEAVDVANFCLFIAWNNRVAEQALKDKT